MRWSPPRSLAVALAGLALGALPWTAPPQVHGQDPPPPAAPAPDADLAKRVEKLDSAINQRLDAGQIAEAVPPAREKLDLLARTRGKDHWQTGDARRDLETYHRLAGLPREVQDRYVKARQANSPGESALCPRPVRRGRAPVPGNPHDPSRHPGRGPPRHRHQLQQPGRDPRPRGSTPRPRRCTAVPWRSGSRPWARTTPTPPTATTTWP